MSDPSETDEQGAPALGHFRLLLEYDGHDFEGWQVQPGARRTIQGCLIEALTRICGEAPKRVTGSGRTDSGVHAEGQVVSASFASRLAPGELLRALNGNLPKDVAVLSIEPASADFDARRLPISKRYRYQIWNAPERSPLRARRFTFVPQRLDLAAMRRAAVDLLGTHDFACFQAAGSDVKTTVRTILSLEIRGESGAEVILEVEGTGFLRHMVRNIAGTLVEVGRGRRAPDTMKALIEGADRRLAGPTAAACGLTLVSVKYEA